MPDPKELLYSNLHEVFPSGTPNAGGRGRISVRLEKDGDDGLALLA